MKGMKILKGAVAALAITAMTANCDILGLEEEEDDNTALLAALALATAVQTKQGTITASETWSGTIALEGTVFVADGVTITITPGTTILGRSGSSLFFLQGSRIDSQGTAAAPIVFTSSQPVGSRNQADWGGIVIIGKATVNNDGANGLTEGAVKIGYTGGTDDNDSSGTIRYTRFEFCGADVSDGDELNCLSMYAVGSGTTLQYIQTHRGQDDGFEWFGGTASASNLIATAIADDSFDLDQNYRGTIDVFIDYKYPASSGVTYKSGAKGLEWDGDPDGATGPFSTVTGTNFTLIGDSGSSNSAMFQDGVNATLTNGVAVNYATGMVSQDNSTNSVTLNNVRRDVAPTAAGGGSAITDNSSGTIALSAVVTTAWTADSPSTCPVLAVIADSGTKDGDWYCSWTEWRNN
jgi:hypothetical protein